MKDFIVTIVFGIIIVSILTILLSKYIDSIPKDDEDDDFGGMSLT